ncbi:MAG TPA: methyltransferase domain-containing protein [Thermoanaerobaculia bacterium]
MRHEEEEYGTSAARYYDPAYAVLRRGSADVEFYRALARETGGPVLELGCGSGRVLLPIVRDGIDGTGLDASGEMLERLRRKDPPAHLRLVEGRMENFDFGSERFALIYSAFRAFQHLLTVEEQLGCLAAVRKHLAPRGFFAFDVFAPLLQRIALPEEPETEDVRFQIDGEEVIRFVSVRRDLATQIMDVTFRYERRREGSVIGNDIMRTRMRYFFRYELAHLLARAGFGKARFFGGFDRRPYDYVSGETVIVASPDGG